MSLSSLSVLLTRPESESKTLSHLLQKERAVVVNVPMFEIEANTSQSDCDLMPHFQIAIFVSKNAARFGARTFLEASKNAVNISCSWNRACHAKDPEKHGCKRLHHTEDFL